MFWNFFIENKAIAWMFTLACIIFGISSWNSLPREIQPEIKIPIAVISTVLPGAGPEDMESLITEKLEKEIANVSDIKKLNSNSAFGFSNIIAEFNTEADMNVKVQELREAVDRVKNDLPEDAGETSITKAEANSFAIVTFALSGDLPLLQISEIADNVGEELEKIPGVSRVQISGNQKRQIRVKINQQLAENFGISIDQINNTIKSANLNLPIGIVSSEQINYSVRLDNRFKNIEEIGQIVVSGRNSPPQEQILLADIATIEYYTPPLNVISRISENKNTAKQAVSIQIYKEDDGDVLKIIEAAKNKIATLKNQIIPPNIKIAISNDTSDFIKEDLGILTENGLQTTILIMILLFLSLGLKQGIIAGFSVPIIFLITFIILEIQGMTINSLSLFSLVIALGLMVDTTIVIMEGIHENMKKGLSVKQSAINSVKTYRASQIAGTLTTIFAFLPMLLVSGILGQFLRTLPITISATLLASLFVALMLIPALACSLIKDEENQHSSILDPFFKYLGDSFQPVIDSIIQKFWPKVFTVISTLLAFLASLALPISGIMQVEMFPKTNQNLFIVRIETPKGTIMEETAKVVDEVEKEIIKIPELENFVSNIGTSNTASALGGDLVNSGASTDSNIANITVNLTKKEARKRKSYEIAEEMRTKFQNFPLGKISIEESREGPPSDPPITVRLAGDSLTELQKISEEIKAIILQQKGTTNVESNFKSGLNEFKFTLDRAKMASFGLSEFQVANNIRNIVQGLKSETVKINDEELTILLAYDTPTRNEKTNLSIQDIENFQIITPRGQSIGLGEIGEYEFGESLATINREEQKRTVKITADVQSETNATKTLQEIQNKIASLNLPIGYEVKYAGDAEEINQSFQELFESMLIGVILIGFTLILMFNSIKQSFIILFTIPLALIGVFPGLYLIGLNLSFPAFLGVVALSGVVVNDAIVLIDRINENRKSKKMSFHEAIAESSNARLQPIIMTTVTTIVGIVPLALSNEFWAGLGFSLVFGLLCATVLTLIVVPVIYYLLEYRSAKKAGEIF